MEHGDTAAAAGGGRGTSIQVTALDGIVNVNSLFTLAAFLGLAWRPSSDVPGLADGADRLNACVAGDRIESDLITLHVLASRSASSRSSAPSRTTAAGSAVTAKINREALRVGILSSAVGSVCGCGFLMMALVNVVQVKLGRLGCGAGGSAARGAVIPLVTLVPTGMLIYIGIVFYAFTR